MSSFNFISTPIAGVIKVQRKKQGDARGFLSRIFCQDLLSNIGWTKPIEQINHTLTQKVGAVRGVHFQHPPFTEVKLVTCISGEVWDVVVDLRQGSATFLHWHAEILSANNLTSLLLPEGVAHGFQVLAPDSELLYCHSASYMPEAEGGLHPLDPNLDIKWPLEVRELSERDQSHPFISDTYKGIITR